MNKTKSILAFLLIAVSATSFGQKAKKNKLKATVEVDIPYTVAKNYFVKNTFTKASFPKAKITSQKQFDAIFGAAAFMGAEGKPTAIDFKTQFAIAIIEKETEYNTVINPISLKKIGKTIAFTCNTVLGEKQTATIRPFILIVVDKKYDGKVTTHNSSITAENYTHNGYASLNDEWIIEHFNQPARPVDSKNCTLRLDEKAGMYSGSDGCNSFSGKVKIKGSEITFENGMRTLRACENMEQGDLFVGNLSLINRFEIKGGELFLYKDEVLIMTLENFK